MRIPKNKKTPPPQTRGEDDAPRYHPNDPQQGTARSSGNGDEPSRSSRTARKRLLHGVGKGLAPFPLSLGRFRGTDFFSAVFPMNQKYYILFV